MLNYTGWPSKNRTFFKIPYVRALMEFAEVDKAARSKMGVWKMQEWTYRHDMARVDNAGGKNVSKLA